MNRAAHPAIPKTPTDLLMGIYYYCSWRQHLLYKIIPNMEDIMSSANMKTSTLRSTKNHKCHLYLICKILISFHAFQS